MAYLSAQFDSRKSYLTGLLSRGRLGRGRLGWDSRKSYLTGCKCHSGMGQDDGSDFDYTQANALGPDLSTIQSAIPSTVSAEDPLAGAPNIAPTSVDSTAVNWAALLSEPTAPTSGAITSGGATVATITPSGVVTPAPGYSVNPATGQIVPGTSWLSQSTLIAGVPNSTVALVAAGGLLLAMLAGGKKRR